MMGGFIEKIMSLCKTNSTKDYYKATPGGKREPRKPKK